MHVRGGGEQVRGVRWERGCGEGGVWGGVGFAGGEGTHAWSTPCHASVPDMRLSLAFPPSIPSLPSQPHLPTPQPYPVPLPRLPPQAPPPPVYVPAFPSLPPPTVHPGATTPATPPTLVVQVSQQHHHRQSVCVGGCIPGADVYARSPTGGSGGSPCAHAAAAAAPPLLAPASGPATATTTAATTTVKADTSNCPGSSGRGGRRSSIQPPLGVYVGADGALEGSTDSQQCSEELRPICALASGTLCCLCKLCYPSMPVAIALKATRRTDWHTPAPCHCPNPPAAAAADDRGHGVLAVLSLPPPQPPPAPQRPCCLLKLPPLLLLLMRMLPLPWGLLLLLPSPDRRRLLALLLPPLTPPRRRHVPVYPLVRQQRCQRRGARCAAQLQRLLSTTA